MTTDTLFSPVLIELLQKALETLPDGLIVIDNTGEQLFTNTAALQILHNNKTALSFYEKLLYLLSFDPLSFLEDTEREVLIKNITYNISVIPLFTNAHKSGVALFLKNCHLLKHTEEIKTDFVSIASHELRNPLTAMKNALEILSTKAAGDLTAAQESFLKIAMRNANRIASLVNEYLDLSKITLDKVPFEFKTYTVQDIVLPVIEEFRERAGLKKISLNVDIPSQLPKILADISKLEQMLANLVDNAVKYTSEGGAITITAQEVKVQVRDNYEQSMVELVVADTGIGVPENKRELIFNTFYRINRAMEVKEEGMGLGLAVVKKLVERHGGQVHVESNVPSGSRFCFTIPSYEGERRDANLRLLFDREFQRARKNQSSLSLIAIFMENFDALHQHCGEQEARRILGELEAAIKLSLYHPADFFISHKRGKCWLLFVTQNDAALMSYAEESSRMRSGF
ncbi:MAG: HAMP domain-containing sensor histidine kinase [Proteobacteria bacterium]|nr:HAMP domain-containing sensor histidine kinase [Pseudomonadota bacterium]